MNDEADVEFQIDIATEKDIHFAPIISLAMEESSKARGTGIAKRSSEKISQYICEGNAVIARHKDGRWAGFCYLALWDDGRFVSNSGLIVADEFRDHGVGRLLKTRLFELSRAKYPEASIVGITTSAAVMKINTSLGFYATGFSQIPKDEKFWMGCQSCVNHDILERTGRKFCLCTAMRFDGAGEKVAHREWDHQRSWSLIF